MNIDRKLFLIMNATKAAKADKADKEYLSKVAIKSQIFANQIENLLRL